MIPSLALLLAAASSGDAPAHLARSTFPTLVRPLVVRADTSSRATSLYREAERLASVGRFDAARTEYRAVIAVLDSSATFPGDALWALATMEFACNHEMRAAAILDQLVDAAVRYGRPEWQARALLEAGIIYQNHGRYDLSVERVRTLKPLLSSPSISPSVRAQIAERVAMK